MGTMSNMTPARDDDTYQAVKDHPGVNWSEVAHEALRRKARELHMWAQFLAGSELTEAEVLEAGDEAKEAILQRLGG